MTPLMKEIHLFSVKACNIDFHYKIKSITNFQIKTICSLRFDSRIAILKMANKQ